MIKALENHEIDLSTRKKVEDWLIAVERHMDRHGFLEDGAGNLDMPDAGAPDYPDWKREAGRLANAGKAILSDTAAYGAHLANITRSRPPTARAWEGCCPGCAAPSGGTEARRSGRWRLRFRPACKPP